MKSAVVSLFIGITLAVGVPASTLCAEETAKTLPTLLIKGEVVSVDTTDPAANVVKVKDRYGFETPILLTPETKITQGDAVVPASSLSTGVAVEVEYNFDVNTAKRHAVSVKLAVPPVPAAEASTTPVEPAPVAPVEPAPAQADQAVPAAQ